MSAKCFPTTWRSTKVPAYSGVPQITLKPSIPLLSSLPPPFSATRLSLVRPASGRRDPGAERQVCVGPRLGSDPDALRRTRPAPQPEEGRAAAVAAAAGDLRPPGPSPQTQPRGPRQAPPRQVLFRCLCQCGTEPQKSPYIWSLAGMDLHWEMISVLLA